MFKTVTTKEHVEHDYKTCKSLLRAINLVLEGPCAVGAYGEEVAKKLRGISLSLTEASKPDNKEEEMNFRILLITASRDFVDLERAASSVALATIAGDVMPYAENFDKVIVAARRHMQMSVFQIDHALEARANGIIVGNEHVETLHRGKAILQQIAAVKDITSSVILKATDDVDKMIHPALEAIATEVQKNLISIIRKQY